jgi:pyridoxamine 5'-phosphate oxidase
VAELTEDDVGDAPMPEVAHWADEAKSAGVVDWDAMVVATTTPDGHPSARVVLLRGLDDRGFRFFTNYTSRKGAELTANPRAAIVLHWREQGRQVRAVGDVVRLDADESRAYWLGRPAASRRSAWASHQSAPVADRDALEAMVEASDTRLGPGGDAELPPFWGGYVVEPHEVELWQHRDDRLHDRIAFLRDGAGWTKTRLQP